MATLTTVPYLYRIESGSMTAWVYPSGCIALHGGDEFDYGVTLTFAEFLSFCNDLQHGRITAPHAINARTVYEHTDHYCWLRQENEYSDTTTLQIQASSFHHVLHLVRKTLEA